MICNCRRDALNNALSSAARAVSAHATVDVLKGVLLEAKDSKLTITGNDMELGIVAVIDAEIKTEGSAVFDAKMICEMVRRVSGETVSIEVNERYLATISSLDSVFDINALSSENYPILPEVGGLRSLTLTQPALKRQLGQTLFSVSESESKLVHTGALFDVEPGFLTVVALDGHRLALRREPVSSDETYSFVIPAASLRELERLLENDEESEVTLQIGPRHVLARLDGITIVSRLLEGEFLKYRNTIPKDLGFKAVIDVKPFTQALERMGLLITEKLKNPVRLVFESGRLTLRCQTGLGRAQDVLFCEGGGEMEIGFNHRYLLDALRRAESDRFRFETSGPLSPCLLLPEDDEDTLFMILPVRL